MLQPYEIAPFLQLAIFLSKADGKIHESEESFIDDARVVHGLTETEVSSLHRALHGQISLSGITCQIKSRRGQLFAVRELVALAYVDGEFAKEEMEVIRSVCRDFGISEEKLTAFDQWVQEGIAWQKRGLHLLEE